LALRYGAWENFRVGEDHQVEVRFGECAAQRSGKRCCRRAVLLAVPSVGIRYGMESRYAERAEAIQGEVVRLEELYE
jgi:hypothetical protein